MTRRGPEKDYNFKPMVIMQFHAVDSTDQPVIVDRRRESMLIRRRRPMRNSTETSMKQRTASFPAVGHITGSWVSLVLASPAGEGAAPRWFAGVLLAVAFSGAPASVVAQDDPCLGIIEAYRVVTADFRDSERFQTHANAFCDEHSQAMSRNRSFRSSGSLEFLKSALNLRQATANEIATKFCSAEDSSRADSDVFRRYKEMISPEAYDAYRICRQTLDSGGARVTPYVSLNKKLLTFSMSDASMDSENFEGIDSDIFECRDGDTTIDRTGVNGEAVSLSSDALNVVCERLHVTCPAADTSNERCPTVLPEEMPSYQFYPEGHVTLNLSSGQRNIEFQRLEHGPIIRELRELEGRVAELRRVSEAHDDSLADLNSFRDSHAHVPLSKMRWHDVKDERVGAGTKPLVGADDNQYSTVTFRNDRDYQIVVSVTADGDSSFCSVDFVVDGTFFEGPIGGNSKYVQCQMSMLVPPRSSYEVIYKKTILNWYEFFASDENEN